MLAFGEAWAGKLQVVSLFEKQSEVLREV